MKNWLITKYYKIKGILFYRHVVSIPDIHDQEGFDKYEEMYNWLTDNDLNDKKSMLSYHRMSTYVEDGVGNRTLINLIHRFEFRFRREEDAVLFKLRWLND